MVIEEEAQLYCVICAGSYADTSLFCYDKEVLEAHRKNNKGAYVQNAKYDNYEFEHTFQGNASRNPNVTRVSPRTWIKQCTWIKSGSVEFRVGNGEPAEALGARTSP
jgi:hypothetical protein